jgi:hypothetical protein
MGVRTFGATQNVTGISDWSQVYLINPYKKPYSQDNDYDRRNRPKPSRVLLFTAVYGV